MFVFSSLLVALSIVGRVLSSPEQIHIAMSGMDGMSVTWFTSEATAKTECRYGRSKTLLTSSASGTQKSYLIGGGHHHSVVLNGLEADTQYFYSCGNGIDMSETFSFKTFPSKESTSKSISLAIFGDMVRKFQTLCMRVFCCCC